MILVLAAAFSLPGLGAGSHGYVVLGGGAGRIAREVPAGKRTGTDHDAEEGLHALVREAEGVAAGDRAYVELRIPPGSFAEEVGGFSRFLLVQSILGLSGVRAAELACWSARSAEGPGGGSPGDSGHSDGFGGCCRAS